VARLASGRVGRVLRRILLIIGFLLLLGELRPLFSSPRKGRPPRQWPPEGQRSVIQLLSGSSHVGTLLTSHSNAVGSGVNAGGSPASGKKYISTLEQVTANFGVDPNTGILTQQDYFEPYEYASLNGGDRDFGSSGACLLDGTTFSGGGVNRLIVAGGKSGKIYVMNADNLGGFANGKFSRHNLLGCLQETGAGGSDAGTQFALLNTELY
jgi:hypothetical protein